MSWWRTASGLLGVALLAASCGRTSRNGPPVESGGSSSEGGSVATRGGSAGEATEGGAPNEEGGAPSASGGAGNAAGAAQSAGAGGDAEAVGGAGGSTGGAASGGEAGAPPLGPSCVYTHPVPVDPAVDLLLDGLNLKTKFDVVCKLELGRRMPVPVDAAHGKLVLQYDLNHDGISDLFFGERSAVGSTRSLRVLMSDPYSDELKFQPLDCEVPLDLSYTRIFARDLDGDGAADWIVGTPSGVKVFANREEGLIEVGSYDFGEAIDSLTLEAVAALGVDGTASKQLAVGYTLVRDGGTLETGVLTFQHVGNASDGPSELEYQAQQRAPTTLGSVALAAFGSGNVVLGVDLSQPAPGGWLWNGYFEQPVPFPDNGYGTPNLVLAAAFGSTPAVVLGFPQHLVFYELMNDGSKLTELGSVETAFPAPSEPGQPRSNRRLLHDLDWDDDSDLIEIGGTDEAELVVSFQESPGVFTRYSRIALGSFPVERKDEDTFLRIGTTQGRVLIRDGDPDSDSAPALQSLLCLTCLLCQP